MSDVKMPRQARQQLAAAELIERQLSEAPAATNVVPIEQAAAMTTPTGQNEVQQQVTAPAVTPPVPQAPVEDFEQKYRTLEGKYRAEVPRLQQQLQATARERDDVGNRLTQLETELRQMRDKPQAQTLDPKDVESFGADLVEMVRRQANTEIERAVQTHLAGLTDRLGRLEQSLTGVTQATVNNAEVTFRTNLKQLVPDFETINVSPKFLEWLGEEDPVYGEPRQAALDRAANRMDVNRTAAVFLAFKQSLPAQAPAPANDLQSQIAPSRTGASVVPSQASQPMVSQNSITQFYRDQTRGLYRGREAEAQRIEAEINRAIAEGRVMA